MLGFLLITCKNGRQLRTYGVNRLEIYNMKFTFICIVTVISCSVCVLGDLEIYPGVKYGPQARRTILADTEDEPTFYSDTYNRWPWQKSVDYSNNDGDNNLRKFQDFNFNLAEILRRSEKEIKRHRDRDEQLRYYPKQHHREPYEYKNLEDDLKDFEPYRHINHNAQLLDDVRMYPQEDDFTFKDDEDENEEETTKKLLLKERILNNRIDEAKTREYLTKIKNVLDHVDDMDHMVDEGDMGHMMDDDMEVSPSDDKTNEKFKDVPFVKDPTEFAYPPSDPRFYLQPASVVTNGPSPLTKPKSDIKPDELIGKIKTSRDDDHLKIKPRSDKNKDSVTDQLIITTDQFHKSSPEVVIRPSEESPRVYIIAIVAGISAAATVGLIAVGIGWYNLQKHVKNASDVEYPAYGITGPNKDTSPSGDRRLAQSAQMYHYQHQKQQILAMENRATATDRHGSVSEADSEEENEEGDYTVYECPGLAPTGEMEVKNPMFQDDPTPAQTPPVKSNNTEQKK